MKPLRLLTVLFTALLLMSCASGEVEPRPGQHTEADAQAPDALAENDVAPDQADTGATDTRPSDSGAPDARPSDTAPSETGAPDTGVTDTGWADSGAVDADATGDDAGQDVRDSGGADSGVECTTDNDCTGGARCHDREPVCVPSCCNNVTHQDSFTAVGYSHNRFDIAVTDAGDPAIVFVDSDNDTIKFAQPINGQWFTQDIGTVSNTSSTKIRMSMTSNGTPHVVLGRYETFKHFWLDSNGWQSADVIADPPSVSYVDIAIDEADNIHMVAVVDYDSVLYAKQTAQGVRSEEYLTLPASENNPVWANISATSDHRPIISLQIGNDNHLVIAEEDAGGTWSYEIVGQDVAQPHGLAVGPDDQPMVAYRKQPTTDGLRLLRRQAQSWDDEIIVADADHGYTPDVAVDALGDPHIVYMASGAGQYVNPLYYARWDGAQWEHHQLDSVGRAFYPRVALDANRTPHAVVFDPDNDAISYLKVQ